MLRRENLSKCPVQVSDIADIRSAWWDSMHLYQSNFRSRDAIGPSIQEPPEGITVVRFSDPMYLIILHFHISNKPSLIDSNSLVKRAIRTDYFSAYPFEPLLVNALWERSRPRIQHVPHITAVSNPDHLRSGDIYIYHNKSRVGYWSAGNLASHFFSVLPQLLHILTQSTRHWIQLWNK